jgi:putative transposase
VSVPAYELFTSTELLGRMAMERMLAGVSTRRYPVALEPVGQGIDDEAVSTSKSAVSRKFVAMTEHALADLLAADLSGLDLVALMIDGVHFADHLCVVALGIDIDGTKHPLALVEGSTENTTLVRIKADNVWPAGRVARPWPGRHPAGPGGPGRGQGPRGGSEGGA